jgi:hypothetical protein
MATINCPKCFKINTAFEGRPLEECPSCGVIYSKAIVRAITDPKPIIEKKAKRPLPEWWTKYAWTVWIPLVAGIISLVAMKTASRDVAALVAWVPWLTFGWIALAFVGRLTEAAARQQREENRRRQNFFTDKGHASEDVIQSFDGNRALVIDADARTVHLYDSVPLGPIRQLKFSDILSAQLFEDGETVSVTRGGASIGGALVGRALFGVAGEIIGGTSGQRRTTSMNYVGIIDLRITLKDIRNPLWDMRFLFRRVNRSSSEYVAVSTRARACVASLHAVMAIGAEAGITD